MPKPLNNVAATGRDGRVAELRCLCQSVFRLGNSKQCAHVAKSSALRLNRSDLLWSPKCAYRDSRELKASSDTLAQKRTSLRRILNFHAHSGFESQESLVSSARPLLGYFVRSPCEKSW